ncbi:MAG: hypothetical protein COA33_001210 [Fluviicola sp.]|nr:hypothetical protein [Fluviicola sp.]
MGIGFTIDTPMKIAQYGIDSVIFIGDDILLEKLRAKFCSKFNMSYSEINEKEEDYRAKRITSYLNLIKEQAEKKFEELKNYSVEKSSELKKYFSMLPDASTIKQEFKQFTEKIPDATEIKEWLKTNLSLGDINVNIMTKLDKVNYRKKEELPVEYNDAHAALRGFANSELSSSIVFSAGMNPRLFSYIENFDDFFPDAEGCIKKKVVLKVSDYRSALIQGMFLAKKGVWVSEYRIESGLNCGGHAFATEGQLMGPILEKFKEKRNELVEEVYAVLVNALEVKGRTIPNKPLAIRVTAQGGVGTSEEHAFLVNNYEVDSVGWGTPFLLVPEVTSVDENTMTQLSEAKEKDLFLSNISPLGVPFNNLRGNSKDLEKAAFVDKGRPGSSCPKKFLALNSQFTDHSICTASRQYQNLKIGELETQKKDLSDNDYHSKMSEIVDKSCICVGLGTSALMVNEVDRRVEGDAVSVCPGPNMAYFSKKSSLQEMVGHIYGNNNVMVRQDRPNMFIKELGLYLKYLTDEMSEVIGKLNRKQEKHLTNFVQNLDAGIEYYDNLFGRMKDGFGKVRASMEKDLDAAREILNLLSEKLVVLKEVT